MHEFRWNPTPLEFENDEKRYVGSVECTRCGLRAPCLTEEAGEIYLKYMSMPVGSESADCDYILIAKVLED